MPMNGDLHLTASERLRQTGRRYTSGRRALIDILAAAGQPLSISDILATGRGLATSSVYRNLAALEQAGVVHRIASSDEFARYELAEDLTEHHHHMICSSCGLVEDFTVSSNLEQTVERAMARVAGRRRFAPAGHRIDLIGLCKACA